MTTLLAGFDSAWTAGNSGAIAAVIHSDGGFCELGLPRIVNYQEAEQVILNWQSEFVPDSTIILLDQPAIVKNSSGQRPVEHIVGSPVSLRYGGMQPANTSRADMFGAEAPMWPFLARFGGPADPLQPSGATLVFETYPVLTMIALGWMLADSRAAGRLPKYNPERRKTFLLPDWRYVCRQAYAAFHDHRLDGIVRWLDEASSKAAPVKSDQDSLDALLCLLVAMHIAEGKECLTVGEVQSGYVLVPHSAALAAELEARCIRTGRAPSGWVRVLRVRRAPGTADGAKGVEVSKPYFEMTATERVAARIARNREMRQAIQHSPSLWSLEGIVAQLNARKQRASYGAVAEIAGGLARGLMNGRPKCSEYSWVVAATGPRRGWPTGYTIGQIHPDCLHQIREGYDNVIERSEDLRRWLTETPEET